MITVNKMYAVTKMFCFISSGLGAYDKAVVIDNNTGEIIGEIHK